MGKPAARMGDTTAHGGAITLGNPTVLIGKMPASALGDMHICPMCTPAAPPIPHVGGPILLGSAGVFIGKKPAARIADTALCVGPPSMPAMGCMTVLIGEVGSGSQAGSAGSAAAALAAKKKGPKAIKPFPLSEPSAARESHSVECEFVDSAGNPMAGVPYLLNDPVGDEFRGVSTSDGRVYHGGYPGSGSFEVHVPELKNARWDASKIKLGEPARFSVEADLPEQAAQVMVNIFANRGIRRKVVATLVLPVNGKKAKGSWLPEYEDVVSPATEGEAVASAGHQKDAGVESPMPESVQYDFVCETSGLVAVSDSMRIADFLEFGLLDEQGEPVPGAEYIVSLASGEIKTGMLDGRGEARIENVEPGEADVRFPTAGRKEKS